MCTKRKIFKKKCRTNIYHDRTRTFLGRSFKLIINNIIIIVRKYLPVTKKKQQIISARSYFIGWNIMRATGAMFGNTHT